MYNIDHKQHKVGEWAQQLRVLAGLADRWAQLTVLTPGLTTI